MSLICRETNTKVRQSLVVTAELGDPSNLARFDGKGCVCVCSRVCVLGGVLCVLPCVGVCVVCVCVCARVCVCLCVCVCVCVCVLCFRVGSSCVSVMNVCEYMEREGSTLRLQLYANKLLRGKRRLCTNTHEH